MHINVIANQDIQEITVKSILMNVLPNLVRMEVHVLMELIATHVNVLLDFQETTVKLILMIVLTNLV